MDRRRLDADALVKCVAFGAITALRVFSLERYVRDEPETSAEALLTDREQEVIGIVVLAEGRLPPGGRGRPCPPDIRIRVNLLGTMAGWSPSKRRPLPGNAVLWRAYVQMQGIVRFWQATRPLTTQC